MKKIVAIVMAMLLVTSMTVALAGNAMDMQTNSKKVKVIIGFVDRPNQNDENLIRGLGGNTKYTYHIIDAKAVELPEQAIKHIKKNPRVKYVEEDVEVHALDETLPWGVDRIGAEEVHASDPPNKGSGVKVAIIDTGIDRNHPDLKDNIKGGRNFVVGSPFDDKFDDNWDDDNGHGTHCAGIVAAIDNDIGVIGVAPEASLYAVKVLGRGGSGWKSDVIAGIQWSVDNGIQVISMSLGGGYSESEEYACDTAYDEGIVLIASAGNEGDGDPITTELSYPAAYGSVIAVGATNIYDEVPSWSNSGLYLELAAPGVGIDSTLPTYKVTLTKKYGSDYGTLSGTSMACPHVAGTAALIIYSDDSLTNGEVRQLLQTSAEDLGAAERDTSYGFGLVDAAAAVTTT